MEDIKEIYTRISECQDDRVITKSYVPPQLYARYMHLSKICTEERKKYDRIKTQLRYGKKDIEIYIKYKGSKEPFTQEKMVYFTDVTLVPVYDHSKKWLARGDKPPRRKVIYNNRQEK